MTRGSYERMKMYRPITERDGVKGKECVYCGYWKELEINYTRGRYDGYDHRCRSCKKAGRTSPYAVPIDDTPRQIGYAMLRYDGAEIAFETDRTQASLTDLWVAVGRPAQQETKYWLRQDGTIALLTEYAQQTNVMLDHVCTARAGVHGGTWAPREIALAYAMYLNPALHLAVLQFVLGRSGEFVTGIQDHSLSLMQQLIAPIYQKLGILELLPGIDASTRATAAALAGAEQIRTREIWNGRIYIIQITNLNHIAIVSRKFVEWPDHRPYLLAVGQTGPEGDLHQLRLKDYAGKFGLEPEDYNVLAEMGSDEPDKTESHLLSNPLTGAVRLLMKTDKKGTPSRTFLASDDAGVMFYRDLPRGYCPLTVIRSLVPVRPPPGQASMF